jgi:hypothetical protein
MTRARVFLTAIAVVTAVLTVPLSQGTAIAQTPFSPFPPVVKFINGQYGGTLQTPGMTLPITGTLEYLSGSSPLIKLEVSGDTGGQETTWVTSTPTVITEWEIASTDPTSCVNGVLSGHSYPQCTAWQQTGNSWSLKCTQGNNATLDIVAVTNSANQLVQWQENSTINGKAKASLDISVQSQSSTPPPASDFVLPSICPTGTNQGENDKGQCTATIPSVCL